MDRYVTGAMIKRLREKCGLTQTELAEKLKVGDKAVSKWETGIHIVKETTPNPRLPLLKKYS